MEIPTTIIQYIIALILLFAGMLIYFKIAYKYDIIDNPNERSSHDYATVRGGGIVFWLAGLFYSVMYLPESIFFLAGISLICGISLWDDITSLPDKVRIIIQFFAVSLIFYDFGVYSTLPWWLIIIAYIFFVGAINAYNFMDGINGITGLYSLVVLICLQYVNKEVIPFSDPAFLYYAILSCFVFLFFNFRENAKCFAGDVGSIGISFWIMILLFQLMLATNQIIWVLFLALYGVDSVCTILHRIYLKQDISKPHRLHFYQILVNEKKYSHLLITSIYAILQLIICVIIICLENKISELFLTLIILIPLMLIYILKFRYMKTKRVK